MDFISPEFIALVLAVSKVAEIIARLTPTKRDDDFIQKVRKFLAVLGVAVKDRKA